MTVAFKMGWRCSIESLKRPGWELGKAFHNQSSTLVRARITSQ